MKTMLFLAAMLLTACPASQEEVVLPEAEPVVEETVPVETVSTETSTVESTTETPVVE